jgi:hypothetical protein
MLQFIASNAATVVISLALAVLVAAIVGRGVKKLRNGQGIGCSCGPGGCARCGGDAVCGGEKKQGFD